MKNLNNSIIYNLKIKSIKKFMASILHFLTDT